MAEEELRNENERLRRRLDREQRARREAEMLGEQGTRALYEQQRQLTLLNVIAIAANGAASVEAAVQVTIDEVCAYTGWPVGHAYLLDRNSPPTLYSSGIWHLRDPQHFAEFRRLSEAKRFLSGEGLPGRVWETGKCVWVTDVTRDANFPRRDAAHSAGLSGAFAFPVLVGPSIPAVLEFFTVEPANADDSWLSLAAQAGTQLGRIFERKRAADERDKLEEQFLRSQRMEAVGTLASGIAHDLNNILAPVLMAAGLLRQTKIDEREGQLIDLIEGGSRRGAEVVKQLLTFNRGVGSQRAPVAVHLLLQDMANIARETFPRDIAIVEKSPAELWSVIADATQLHQVLMNFCVNARDAMPAGGTLTLGAQNVELKAGEVNLHARAKPGLYVVVTVSDTGQGISAENIQRIFDPFFTTKAFGKGTGLGLSTVIGIVNNHGGFVTVYSELGLGSVFKAYLPAVIGLEETAGSPEAEPPMVGRGELILAVDDEPTVREATRLTLESHNYVVATAANGQEALELFLARRDEVKLVVTDAMMPIMGGVALIRALRIVVPSLKVIVTTGLDREDKRAELMAIGVTKILAKPCSPQDLLREVGRCLA